MRLLSARGGRSADSENDDAVRSSSDYDIEDAEQIIALACRIAGRNGTGSDIQIAAYAAAAAGKRVIGLRATEQPVEIDPYITRPPSVIEMAKAGQIGPRLVHNAPVDTSEA